MDTGDHLLNQIGALLHHKLTVTLQGFRIEGHATEMGMQDGASLDGVHAAERMLLALLIEVG